MSLLSKMIMMSGLEVAMAHVAGPGLTQEGADEKKRKEKHNQKDTQKLAEEEEGRSDWESHNTQR